MYSAPSKGRNLRVVQRPPQPLDTRNVWLGGFKDKVDRHLLMNIVVPKATFHLQSGRVYSPRSSLKSVRNSLPMGLHGLPSPICMSSVDLIVIRAGPVVIFTGVVTTQSPDAEACTAMLFSPSLIAGGTYVCITPVKTTSPIDVWSSVCTRGIRHWLTFFPEIAPILPE